MRSADKLHLNERGHALAAQEIASQILNQRNLYFGGQPAEPTSRSTDRLFVKQNRETDYVSLVLYALSASRTLEQRRG